MSRNLRARTARLGEQLEELRREIRLLNHTEQRALLVEMRNVASIVEQTMWDINHAGSSKDESTPNNFNTPFETWLEQEIRRGADYGSVADAAAAYEAAGYNFL